MMMKPRHPAIVKRYEATRRSLQTVPPIRIPQWLDEELERELTAPCLYFRTGYVLKADIAPTIDAVTARLLRREIEKGKGGQRRKLGSDCARERA